MKVAMVVVGRMMDVCCWSNVRSSASTISTPSTCSQSRTAADDNAQILARTMHDCHKPLLYVHATVFKSRRRRSSSSAC